MNIDRMLRWTGTLKAAGWQFDECGSNVNKLLGVLGEMCRQALAELEKGGEGGPRT